MIGGRIVKPYAERLELAKRRLMDEKPGLGWSKYEYISYGSGEKPNWRYTWRLQAVSPTDLKFAIEPVQTITAVTGLKHCIRGLYVKC